MSVEHGHPLEIRNLSAINCKAMNKDPARLNVGSCRKFNQLDLKSKMIIIEGLRAKRAYVGFWPIFIFLQDRANFSQTDLF